MTIAICDSDLYFINLFGKILASYFGEQNYRLDLYTSGSKLLASDVIYDIVFLELEMSDIDGIKVSKQINSSSEVVFVTNKEYLVFKAYNSTNSFGFIRKSNLKDDLDVVIKRYMERDSDIDALIIEKSSKLIRIKTSDVLFFEKYKNDVIIHTSSGDYSERKAIKQIELELNSKRFIRCHSGYIVNLDTVNLIDSKDITLSTGQKIPVSRNNIKRVRDAFIKRNMQAFI